MSDKSPLPCKPGAVIRPLDEPMLPREHFIYTTPAEEAAYRLGGIAAVDRMRRRCKR